jgi:RNA polymerase sigma-70 factor (ECF subfamily)
MPDLELILWSRVRHDDSKAFEILFRKHYPVLCLLSRGYTHDITTSREIVQDIFIHLWEYRQELDITTSIKSYLSSAVKYNSIRRMENDKKGAIRMDVLPEQDQEFFDHLEYAELQAMILEAIESLPDQCKKVFIMSRFDQLKYSEIAQCLALSVKTVEAHISKALHLIQDHLNRSLITLLILQIYKYL